MLTVNGRMAVSTGVIDGYIISNWTEEALADMLDQTTLKDNPLGFTDLTPIGVDGVAAGLEDRHVEFIVGEELYTESVNRAVEMGGMDGGLPKMEGVNVGMLHMMGVAMQKRVGYMAVQLSNLLIKVNGIKSQMIDFINTQNGMMDHQTKNKGRSMVISVYLNDFY